MRTTHGDDLSTRLPDRCRACGTDIWIYDSLNGNSVALEDAPGPYLIDGKTAYRSNRSDGYRSHWDYCGQTARPQEVGEHEFLWS
jgi:hypothetical protein